MNLEPRYDPSVLTPGALVRAAHDWETSLVPDDILVPAVGQGPPVLVRWRDPGEPMERREAAAAEILKRFGAGMAALHEQRWCQTPSRYRPHLRGMLERFPGGTARLMAEIKAAGIGLTAFLNLSLGPLIDARD
jgi:hypothetical protein